MPSSLLFCINTEGRVYALSTGSSVWREFLYLGLEFKRVAAVPHFLWAIGVDRQVYVHVHGLDIPIRIKEEAYENERWLPLEGFSSRLLPTDRHHFSSMDGLIDRSIDRIRLPSMAWQWEGDWHIDTTLDGQPLDHDGWSYAIDFPAQYGPKKQWKSCVRRRKWVRYRRYSALNSWCAVAPLHKDPTQEPFIDVSIGGNCIPGAAPGMLMVWAVTSNGRVMHRTGVSTTAPEGLRWTVVSVPGGCEVIQISVGPTGLVWAVLWNGRVLVRSGVTKEMPTGTCWLDVKPPGEGHKIVQVSVGTNSVWCVTLDKDKHGQVWFRKGVRGEGSGVSEECAIGSGWVEMVGSMSQVTVAHNDQVWAIGIEDRCLYYRSGVNDSDPTGKKWRCMQAPLQLSRTSSNASLSSNINRRSISGSPRDKKHRSWTSLNRNSAVLEPPILISNFEETSRSAPTPQTLKIKQQDGWKNQEQDDGSTQGEPEDEANSVPDGKQLDSLMVKTCITGEGIKEEPDNASTAPGEPFIVTGKHFETTLKNPRAWSPVRSVGSMVGTEAHPYTDCSVFDPDLSRDSGVFGEEDDQGGLCWAEHDATWSWATAGGCTVDPAQLPNWFMDCFSSMPQAELIQPWRLQILENLKTRVDNMTEEFSKYDKPIETSSWIKTGEARCSKNGNPFEDCLLELEWVSNSGAGLDSGTLTILNPDGATTKMQFSLSEITCVVCCSEAGSPRIAIHAPRLPSSPVKLQFSGDTDMEDWMANLTSVCCQMNEVNGRPSQSSIWATTALGDVFVFDPTSMEASQLREDKLYTQEIDVSATETPYMTTLYNGFPSGTILQISGCVYDEADKMAFDLQCHTVIKVKHKAEKQIRDIPLHFNPRFNESKIVMNTMTDLAWGDEQREEMVFRPGSEFVFEVVCTPTGYQIIVDYIKHSFYKHRVPPETVSQLSVTGKVKLFKIVYKSNNVIVPLQDMFWRQMGGHLRRVETCNVGITWGISYDHTAYVYTGGWGGSFLKGLETSTAGINSMTDTHNYFVYENQRWNPLTGFSTTGLPTDRYMWSDVTGRMKRTREHTKLLSMHWQWVSDWIVDFHTPGGVDRDGWQYAVDFPATYHGKKNFTDYVRRRRWFRRCRLTTNGPWQEVGNTKIIDVSLQATNDIIDSPIIVWAVTVNGDALFRKGVSTSNPSGVTWEHIPSDQPLISISCGPNGTVWAVGRNGLAYWRFGITSSLPQGEVWNTVEPPVESTLKQVSVGAASAIWAVDTMGRLAVRREVSNVFPEGSHWQLLQSVSHDPPHLATCATPGFRHVSVGSQVWATSTSGIICHRCGITAENPAGTGWNIGIMANWQHASIRGLKE